MNGQYPGLHLGNTQAGANQGFTRIKRGKSDSESVVNAWKRQDRIAAV